MPSMRVFGVVGVAVAGLLAAGVIAPGYRALGTVLSTGLAGFRGWTAGGILGILPDHAMVVFWGLFVLAACRCGAPLRRFLGTPSVRSNRPALDLILGWGLLASGLFGLALAGVFFRSLVIVALAAGVLAGGFRFRIRRVPVSGPWWLAFPVVFVLPLLFAPPVYVDFYQYHAAVPARFLAQHRFAVEGANDGFHLPFMAELLNAVAVISGHDAVVAWIGLIPFVCGLAIIGSAVSGAGPLAVSIGIALAVTNRFFFSTIGMGKNDLAAAGLCLAAAGMMMQRRGTVAGCLWGMAAAAKPSGMVFALSAWGVMGARRWRWLPVAGWWVAPWLLKGWLLRGDPLWAVFSRWIPGSLWDDRSIAIGSLAITGWADLPERLRSCGAALYYSQPALACLLPFAVIGRKALAPHLRRVLLTAVVALLGYGLLVGREAERIALPLVAIAGFALAVPFARELAGVSSRVRAASLGLLVVAGWSGVGPGILQIFYPDTLGFVTGRISEAAFRGGLLTTAHEARIAAERLAGLRTLLLVSDHTPYRWPGRVMTEEFYDRSPTWVLARDAADPARLRIRLRQRNVTHLGLNFVAETNLSAAGGPYAAFDWSARQLDVLYGFMRAYTEVAAAPAHVDGRNGGFYLWNVMDRPTHGPDPWVHYLPGIKGLLWQVWRPLLAEGDHAQSRARAEDLIRRYPGVGGFHATAGYSAQLGRDWEAAARHQALAIGHGTVSEAGHGLLADAWLALGRPQDAIRGYRVARTILIAQGPTIDRKEARAWVERSRELARSQAGLPSALAAADEAVRLAGDDPWGHLERGQLLLRLRRLEEAQTAFNLVMDRWRSNHAAATAAQRGLDLCRRLGSATR